VVVDLWLQKQVTAFKERHGCNYTHVLQRT
jgi:hypothetical protein